MTKADRSATEWRIKDEIIRLREWGTETVHSLPPPPVDKVLIGTADTCLFRLVDPSGHTSREHARLDRQKHGWTVRDLDSRNGIRFDGTRGFESRLEPGTELGIGNLTLVAESQLLIELRSFLLRLLGWGADQRAAVDLALRAIRLAAMQQGEDITGSAVVRWAIARAAGEVTPEQVIQELLAAAQRRAGPGRPRR